MTEDDRWVFGYGSLMWRPEFEYIEAQPASLFGAHRSLCIYSTTYRGTAEKPGLVLGLDHGGSCKGVAFRVARTHWPRTLAYLRERELLNDVYKEKWCRVHLTQREGVKINALCYLADREHQLYAGGLDIDRQADLVHQGVGVRGANPEYLANTVAHLRDMGIRDRRLFKIHDAVLRRAET